MNRRLRKAIAALVLCAPGASACAAEASEAQWIAAAQHAIAFGKAHGLAIDLEVVHGNGLSGHTPIGVWSENGRCTLVVSARDNPTAARLADMIEPGLVDLFLHGAAMHEVGHCYRRVNGYPHNEKLAPLLAWIAPMRSWFARRIRTEEVFADMTEVAWLARYHPERFDAMLGQIRRVRTRFLEPKHDTLAWLDAAREHPAAAGGANVFQHAEQLMSR